MRDDILRDLQLMIKYYTPSLTGHQLVANTWHIMNKYEHYLSYHQINVKEVEVVGHNVYITSFNNQDKTFLHSPSEFVETFFSDDKVRMYNIHNIINT